MKGFKTIWAMVGWVLAISFGFIRFLIKKPQATLAISKFIVLKLHKVPKRVRFENLISKNRILLAQRISQCALMYQDLKIGEDVNNLQWLEKAYSLIADRWVLLYLLVRVLKPDIVVETGVGDGVSTSYILQGMADNSNGLLISIDLPNQFYILDNGQFHADFSPFQERPGRLIPNKLRDRWKLIIGSSRDKLPSLLANLGKVDLFLHDSEHTCKTMLFELECAWPYLRSGGYLVADDTNSNSSLFDFAGEKGIKPMIIGNLGFIYKP